MTTIKENTLIDIAEGKTTPMGTVKVQIFNERGKCVDEEVKDNYIGPVWQKHARALLRTPWFTFGYNTLPTGQETAGTDNSLWPHSARGTIPRLPITAIGCWNDTSAEDPVAGHQISLPASTTGMIAWASRWPFASPTGARGSVDITNSVQDDDTSRFIFDWTTAQGNGTFQSVGWFEPGAPGIPFLPHGYAHRANGTTGLITPSTHLTGATSLNIGGGYFDSATSKWYFPVRRQATSGLMRIVSVPFTSVADDSLAGINGASPLVTGLSITNESAEFTPTSALTSASLLSEVIGINSLGEFIFYYPISGSARLGKIAVSPGANTSYAWPAVASNFCRGAVIGNNAYITSGTTDSNIYVVDTTDGSLDATLTIDASVTALCTLSGITTPRVFAMCADGTSLYVVYGQSPTFASGKWLCVRLNTSGVLQEIVGVLPHYQTAVFLSESTGAPYAGTHVYATTNWAQLGSMYPLSVDSSGSNSTTENLISIGTGSVTDSTLIYNDPQTSPATHQIRFIDGALYSIGCSSASPTTVTSWNVYRHGYNLGSRVLLATPKTKTGAQTMKNTYDVTVPGWT